METKKEEESFDFWQDHSSHYLEMAFRRDKIERCETADGYGKRKGVCGDTIEMFLTIRDHQIQYASFDADGCMNTLACANTVVHMIEGKTVDQAWEVTTGHVVDFLETLPAKDNHCAELAVGALYMALSDFQKKSYA